HERLAFVHRAHDVELGKPVVPDLSCHELLWDDANHFAARPQNGVREHTHQAHVTAAVHQTDFPAHEFRTQFLGGSAVLRTAAGTGAAENADSFHAPILNLASAIKGKPATS